MDSKALLGWVAGLAFLWLMGSILFGPGDPKWKAQVERIKAEHEIRVQNAREACALGVQRGCE